MSRHALCKLPANDRLKQIPISIKPVPAARKEKGIDDFGILGEVRKVSADVNELQKIMAVESAARNQLEMCVEQLRVETVEAKKYFAQEAKNVGRKRRSDCTTQSLHLFMKKTPCKSLAELDWLLAYIENRNSQWV